MSAQAMATPLEALITDIQQPSSVVQRCLAAYRSSPDMDTACSVARVHKLTMFKILKTHGAIELKDKLRIGSIASRIGASAEAEFLRLVPHAKSMNAIVSSNPGFDFDVNGWHVDVKSSSPTHIGKTECRKWSTRISNTKGVISSHVDMFCIFMLDKMEMVGPGADGYRIYLLPADLVRGRRYVQKTEDRPSELDAFKVAPEQLASFFEPIEGSGA